MEPNVPKIAKGIAIGLVVLLGFVTFAFPELTTTFLFGQNTRAFPAATESGQVSTIVLVVGIVVASALGLAFSIGPDWLTSGIRRLSDGLETAVRVGSVAVAAAVIGYVFWVLAKHS